jgi:hypothetical protein
MTKIWKVILRGLVLVLKMEEILSSIASTLEEILAPIYRHRNKYLALVHWWILGDSTETRCIREERMIPFVGELMIEESIKGLENIQSRRVVWTCKWLLWYHNLVHVPCHWRTVCGIEVQTLLQLLVHCSWD